MRRHTQPSCMHNPPCCYSDGGTDSSVPECCLPRCRNHSRKKKPQTVNSLRPSKRHEGLLALKHCHTAPRGYTSSRCNKTRIQPVNNNENRFLRQDIKKMRQKSGRMQDEASSCETGSISSQPTSVSVDVSYEMAAVNKEIEALLARRQKAIEGRTLEGLAPRMKMPERGGTYNKYNKYNLTYEQMKLVMMNKPPIDKLKELPHELILENLKPRPPPSHLQKEKVLPSNNQGKKDLKESFEAFIQKEQSGDGLNRSELLKSMWQNVVESGLAKDDSNKTIKPIYTSVTLEDDTSININFGSAPTNEDSQLNKGNSVGTVISPRMKFNPSIGTQTSSDYNTIINKMKPISNFGISASKRTDDSQKKNCSDSTVDHKSLAGIPKEVDIGDNFKWDINKPTTTSTQPKSSGDGPIANNTKETLAQLIENKMEPRIKNKFQTMFPLPHQKEMTVYSLYNTKNDHLISTNNLLSKNLTEINGNEKMCPINRTTPELFSKGKEIISPIGNDEKVAQESEKKCTDKPAENSPQFDIFEKMAISSPTKTKNNPANSDLNEDNSNNGQDNGSLCSLLNHISPDLKEMTEKCDRLDTPLCVEIIKRLTDTMMKCEPGKLSEELTTRNCYLYLDELRKLRAQHLRHIQNEVKHIEELDKFLDNIGIAAQLFYSPAKLESH